MRIPYPAVTNRAYDEIIDWLAGGFTPDALVACRPSDAVRERVADLIRQDKNAGLTSVEATELAHYLQIKHLLRLAKARARRITTLT
ncbi:MAG: hypothetical protein ACRYFX_20510 [Janthinobacterium lividum]